MDIVADDLHFLQLTELAACIKAGAISPLEATRAQLDRIAALDGALGSYILVMAEAAMAQAETAQAARWFWASCSLRKAPIPITTRR